MITTIFMSFLQSFLVSILLFVNIYGIHSKFSGNGGTCQEREQTALLQFKAELIDEYGRLSSWGSTNCCVWKGVVCDNRTNHVVALDLHGDLDGGYAYVPLRGKISPSLLQLPHLQYLDLSFNDFNVTTIPYFIGSLSKLQNLILSYSGFESPIPYHIGNLSALRFLDLTDNDFGGSPIPEFIGSLSKLQHLNLGFSSFCGPIPHHIGNLSALRFLDLSFNHFDGSPIPKFIGSLRKLQHLGLSYCNFGGPIPHHIGNLSALRFLDLGYNLELTDTNIDWLSGSPSLEFLDLSSTSLKECTTWVQPIHKLTALKELYLSVCHLPTVEPISVPSHNSSNSLVVLDLSYNIDLFSSSAVVLSWFLNMSSSFALIHLSQYAFEVEGRNLSQNAEGRNNIPASLGNCKSLSYLGLQYSGLDGSIPNAIGNLTSLSYLDLSGNQLQGEFPQTSKNSSSLTHLDLSGNKLNGKLPHLLTWLHGSTRLKYLYLSDNVLCDTFPNMSRFLLVRELRLQDNLLNGSLLEGNLRLPHLEILDLSRNNFIGKLPNLSSCLSLRVIFLSENTFNVILKESIGNLPKLEEFVVGYNKLEGVITEAHLSSLPKLQVLDLSFNINITLMINSSWIHPVQFRELRLAFCKLGPHFPKWLQKQNQVQTLDISNSGILDTIPSWFWGNVYMCYDLNLSHNHISGELPNITSKFIQLRKIDLSSNELTGPLPLLPLYSFNIGLSTNKFSGTIHHFCNLVSLYDVLDLSNNQLFGDIPQDCFMKLLSLPYLNLANNHFSGEIPITNSLCGVSLLHLRNNSFKGEIPRSLMNCSELRILDLGENEFSGTIPRWLGESMPKLGVLILKSNKLYGSLPTSICHLAKLQVLDISLNKITRTIPNCFNNFTLLSSADWNNSFIASRNDTTFYDSASVDWKGKKEIYMKNLQFLKMIDLSSNELNGEIPHEITSLFGLLGLNLSRNNLVGFIPDDIGQMKLMDSLDLSRNKLSGGIPPTLSQLSHLGVLDLSFNNLSGRIPWETQLQTFNAFVYSGNPRLCGLPLVSRPCPEDEKPTKKTNDSEEEHEFMMRDFYISMLIGFIVAFWGVFWALFVSKWWNAICMKIYITVGDWLYVKILVNKRRLIRYFGNA